MHVCNSTETTLIHQWVAFTEYCIALCGRPRENWMKNQEMMMINGYIRVQHVTARQHITEVVCG